MGTDSLAADDAELGYVAQPVILVVLHYLGASDLRLSSIHIYGGDGGLVLVDLFNSIDI